METGFYKKAGKFIIVWGLGNITWASATFVFSKFVEDTEVLWQISAIGFLFLVLVGVVGAWWYFLRERQSPTPDENMARWVTAMYFAQKYNVSPDDLLTLNSPEAMEERARRLIAERHAAEWGPPLQSTPASPKEPDSSAK
ncbi:MAG: hypothetical protein O6920_01645 [Chloroflexi bacterium]|nr:hypothetical protein [Chloroflexota bacterium]